MRRIVLLLFTLHLLLPTYAQVRLGYLSYDTILHQMPEYAQAQQNLSELKAKYEQEAKRGEEEFQRKFTDFLEGQKEFPENILVKRQAELQVLMDTGIKFRQEAEQLLSKAEQELMGGVRDKLNHAIQEVGQEGAYAAVLNTDGNACPFVNPVISEDVTPHVLRKLGIPEGEK